MGEGGVTLTPTLSRRGRGGSTFTPTLSRPGRGGGVTLTPYRVRGRLSVLSRRRRRRGDHPHPNPLPSRERGGVTLTPYRVRGRLSVLSRPGRGGGVTVTPYRVRDRLSVLSRRRRGGGITLTPTLSLREKGLVDRGSSLRVSSTYPCQPLTGEGVGVSVRDSLTHPLLGAGLQPALPGTRRRIP